MYAKLTAADFSLSNLGRADFEGAEFHGASFKGANVSGVNIARWYVTREQLLDVTTDGKTKLPLNVTSPS